MTKARKMQVFVSAASNASDIVQALELALRHHCRVMDWGFHSISSATQAYDTPLDIDGNFHFCTFLDVPVTTRNASPHNKQALAAIARDKVAEAIDSAGILFFGWHWPANTICKCKTCQLRKQADEFQQIVSKKMDTIKDYALAIGVYNNLARCMILASTHPINKRAIQKNKISQHSREASFGGIDLRNHSHAPNIVLLETYKQTRRDTWQPRSQSGKSITTNQQPIDLQKEITNGKVQPSSQESILQPGKDQQIEPLFCLTCHLRIPPQSHQYVSAGVAQNEDRHFQNTHHDERKFTLNVALKHSTSSAVVGSKTIDHTRLSASEANAKISDKSNSTPPMQQGNSEQYLLQISRRKRHLDEMRDNNIYPLQFAPRKAGGSAPALNKDFAEIVSQESRMGKSRRLLLPASRPLMSENRDKPSSGWPSEHWTGYLSLKGYFENLQRMKARNKPSPEVSSNKKKPSI